MKEQLENAKKILVALDLYADLDEIVSALSLCKVLTQAEKRVTLLIHENKYTNEIFKDFPTGDIRIIGKNEPDSFIVRLGSDDAIVKDVKWQEEDGKLNIFVTTFKGKLDQAKINIEPNYSVFDLVIMLGVEDTTELGNFYQENRKAFPKSKIIQIGNLNKNLGAYKFDKESICMAHLVTQFLLANNYAIDSDIATDLLAALLWKTEGLKYSSNIDIVDSLYELVQKGASLSSASEKAYNRIKFGQMKLASLVAQNFKLIDKQNAFVKIGKKEIQGIELENVTASNWTILENIQGVENIFILIEKEEGTRLIIKSSSSRLDARNLLPGYEAKGDKYVAQLDTKDDVGLVEGQLMKALNSTPSERTQPLGKIDRPRPTKKEEKPEPSEDLSGLVSADPLQPATELPEPLSLNKDEPRGGYTPPPPITPLE